MVDRIRIERIAVFARHGVHAAEEKLGQRFYVSIACEADLREAGLHDDFERTVCYAGLTALVVEIATTRRFRIIEGLAEALARELLAAFPRIAAVTVRIEKPNAPIPAIIDGVSVEITRRRDEERR